MPDNQKALEKAILSIKVDGEKQAIESMKPILQAYKRSLDDVKGEIAKIYMEYTVDGELKIGKQQRLAVLKELEKKLVSQAKELGAKDVEVTSNILEDSYKDAYYKTAYTIDTGVKTGIDFSMLKPESVKAAVNMPVESIMFSDRIWKNKELLVNRVKRDVEQAIIQGKSVEKLARQIKNTFGSSAYESQRLISNEVARCMSQAQDEIYKNSDVVEQIQFCSTLDAKTSNICQDLDGNTYDKTDNYPTIPDDTHVGCRSCYVPVIKNYQPSTRRDNSTSDTIPYKTYSEWSKDKGI